MKQPLRLNLSVWQGQTFDDQLVFKNEDGTPVDLTGYEAAMQLRASIEAPVIVEWSSAEGQIVLGGAAGSVAFAVSAQDTYALPTDNATVSWVYDLRVVNGAGYAERLVEGVVVVYPAVTRAP